MIEQSPSPGQKRAPGTPIDLTVYDPASLGDLPTVGAVAPGRRWTASAGAVVRLRLRPSRGGGGAEPRGVSGAGRPRERVRPASDSSAGMTVWPSTGSVSRSSSPGVGGSKATGVAHVLPARADLVAEERQTPAVETAVAGPRGDGAAVVAAGRAARRGPVADPAPRSLGLGRLAMRTPPRHGPMVAAVADAVTSPARPSPCAIRRGARPRTEPADRPPFERPV